MSIFDSQNQYLRISKVAPLVIFVLMIFGGYIKAIGAGLACPDWPLCHGQFIPLYFDGEPPIWVLMEFVHRLVALTATFIIIGLVLFSYKHRYKDKIGNSRFFLTLAIFVLLTVQILLGGLTVLSLLDEIIVTTHLALATAIFGLTIIHYYWISPKTYNNSE